MRWHVAFLSPVLFVVRVTLATRFHHLCAPMCVDRGWNMRLNELAPPARFVPLRVRVNTLRTFTPIMMQQKEQSVVVVTASAAGVIYGAQGLSKRCFVHACLHMCACLRGHVHVPRLWAGGLGRACLQCARATHHCFSVSSFLFPGVWPRVGWRTQDPTEPANWRHWVSLKPFTQSSEQPR